MTLYFASDREGGFGGMDIYRSSFDGTKWTAPENLGEDVNTKVMKSLHFIHPACFGLLLTDTKAWVDTISLCAEYQCRFLNVQYGGYGINSVSNDYFPCVKNLVMYFTSDRIEGKGKEDIYRAPITEHNYTVETYEAPMVSVVEPENAEEENEPAAYAINEAAVSSKGIENIDAMLTGARRVSIGEVISTKDKTTCLFHPIGIYDRF